MDQIQYFYEQKIKKIPFIPRKVDIKENENILVKGIRFSGKTFLIKDYLSRQKNFLYINLNDIRVDLDYLQSNLQTFIDKNRIEIVAIDNYKKDFLIPNSKQIILSTNEPIYLDGFEMKNLYTLDFEEYMAFEKAIDTKIVFNNFLKNGTFPEISKTPEFKRNERFFEMIAMLFKKDIEILKEISNRVGHKSSIYQIYTLIKDKTKISKDRFYSFFEYLKETNLIFILEKFSYPKASKKIYFCDFALKNYLSFNRDFSKIFENAIFLELFKRDFNIFYFDRIDFFIPSKKEAILSIPFGNEVGIQKRVSLAYKYLKELEIEKVTVVSVANGFKFYENDIFIEVLPFYEWALKL